MPKEEWGVKRLCPSCATRFYDLQNDPMTCPSCGNTFDLDSLLNKKTPRAADKKETVDTDQTPVADDAEEEVVLVDDDDDDDDVEIGDDLLDDDDDDDTVDIEDIADVPSEDDD